VPGAGEHRCDRGWPSIKPCATSSVRQEMINARIAALVARGFECGRRDFGSIAGQPPARHAAIS
jgi:hypothetical protein